MAQVQAELIHSLGRGLHKMPRLTRPSVLHGTANEYQFLH